MPEKDGNKFDGEKKSGAILIMKRKFLGKAGAWCMTRKELQKLLDKQNMTAGDMLQIGKSYLRGDVLKDVTAAERWLERAVAQEAPLESALAMSLLATEVYGRNYAVSEQDFEDMKEEAEKQKDTELAILLQIAEQERKKE